MKSMTSERDLSRSRVHVHNLRQRQQLLSAENRTSCLGISIINKRGLNLYQTAVESQICNLDLFKKKSLQSSELRHGCFNDGARHAW